MVIARRHCGKTLKRSVGKLSFQVEIDRAAQTQVFDMVTAGDEFGSSRNVFIIILIMNRNSHKFKGYFNGVARVNLT